ncbi:MAG: DUF6891 domain-containing protein [Bradymonadia bacterium]
MNHTPLFQVIDDLRHFIEYTLLTGFTPEDELVDAAVGAFTGAAPEATLRPYALKLAGEIAQAQKVMRRGWPEHTDCDRLDAAFEQLKQSGILSRQHFTCCGTCGAFEMQDEIARSLSLGERTRGYVFYHEQDTESAVDGYGLYLSYGATEAGEAAALGVAEEIVDALHRAGLKTRWNGKWSARIWVDLEWRRRPPVAEAEAPMQLVLLH